jgi:hypothetical protein
MYLLQHEGECGYKMTERLHISADRGWNFGKTIMKADGQEEVDQLLGPTWTH